MESAGITIGIGGLLVQLAKVSRMCYTIFSEMKEIGYAHDPVLHDLWAEGLAVGASLVDGNSSNQLRQHLDPTDERYRHAVATLVKIVAVFGKVAELQARSERKSEKDDKHGTHNNLRVGRLFSRFRSKSPRPGSSNPSQPAGPLRAGQSGLPACRGIDRGL
ncbi:hypothetical protein BDZ91DRAFT_850706 [Kalaharituber pfeilii]|nr:hypothetical protein BDZ91DRAFT_850706 [Kalaharituber pfeilii]